ncbi:TPM domain-containing protein [Myroides sp. LJL119]
MDNIHDFLTKQDELQIVQAITNAEINTTGEIRIHLENKSSIDSFERATEVFQELNMANTKNRNAVLFYICAEPRGFVILGDQGINDLVKSEDFWESTKQLVINQFKIGNYKQGLIDGVTKAGKKLQELFPSDQTNTNEISNEISKS